MTLVFSLIILVLPFVHPQLTAQIGGLIERVFLGLVLTWILGMSVYLERLVRGGHTKSRAAA